MADDDVIIPRCPDFTEPSWLPTAEGCAQVVFSRAAHYRYVRVIGRWLVYDHGRWRWDESGTLERLIADTLVEVGNTRKRAIQERLETLKNIGLIEKRLRSLLPAISDQWDRDLMLLNCADSAVDLRQGREREARLGDYCTRSCAVSPSGSCPLWHEHLKFVTGGDAELEAYLQRAVGYTLTGRTEEEALFFVFGPGGAGKGVFVNTIADVLGTYAQAAAMSTFTHQRYENHPEELAVLKGARMVVASETEAGHAWTEARIKALTGNDKIRARFMRQDSFEFAPQFKLWIMGNHKPTLFSPDESIRRRFHIVQFLNVVADEDKDRELRKKLRAEWPGILQWAIDGCRLWLAHGLAPPAVVREATADYIAAEDVVGAWIDEELITDDPDAFTPSLQLFRSWLRYAKSLGEDVGSMKRLSQDLVAHGHKIKRTNKCNGFCGLSVRPKQNGTTSHVVGTTLPVKAVKAVTPDFFEREKPESEFPEEPVDLDEARRRSRTYVVLGAVLQGKCEQCGRTDGDLKLIREKFRGTHGHVLHDDCALAFFEQHGHG